MQDIGKLGELKNAPSFRGFKDCLLAFFLAYVYLE